MDKIKAAWARIKTLCAHSLTMAVGYVTTALGIVFSNIDALATAMQDQAINTKMAELLNTNPKALGYWLTTVGIVTTVARARSLIFKAKG